MLHFDGKGHTRNFLMEINADGDKAVANALAAQMDKIKLQNK